MIRVFVDASTYKSRLCLYDENKRRQDISYEKRNTINVLEYRAIQKGIKYINATYPCETVQLFSDSKLIVNQITDRFKINNKDLFEECFKCKELLTPNITLFWVPRGKNKAGRILETMVNNRI